MKKFFLLFIFVIICSSMYSQSKYIDGKKRNFSQQTEEVETKRVFDMGFGFGLDYGGLGGKMSLLPSRFLAIFGSAGYHLVDFGWQVGVTFYILPKTNLNSIRPYVKVMYGTNRVIKIDGASYYNKNYMGLTPGIGVEFRFGKTQSSGINIDLNLPVSSQDFKDDYDVVENDPDVRIDAGPFPLAFSIGYHFEL